jgi:hypothetical protein
VRELRSLPRLVEQRRVTLCIVDVVLDDQYGDELWRVYKSRTSVTKKFRYMGYSFKVM